MTGCPMAYMDPCSSCNQYGSCAPSQAVEKIKQLEALVLEIKQMMVVAGKNNEDKDVVEQVSIEN